MSDKPKKPCPDCGAPINIGSQRCASCSVKAGWANPERRAKAVASLQRAFPAKPRNKCIDCDKPLKKLGALRCVACSNRAKATRDPYWLHTSRTREERSETARRQFANPERYASWREGIERRNADPQFHAHAWMLGPLNPAWKGGVTPENHRVRSSAEYKAWRRAVFLRDDFTCQSCRKRGVALHAHHLEGFAERPDLRLALENGTTLCIGCHRDLHGLTPKELRVHA